MPQITANKGEQHGAAAAAHQKADATKQKATGKGQTVAPTPDRVKDSGKAKADKKPR
jgi:hypothetical protein